jgi:hypothetical protein
MLAREEKGRKRFARESKIGKEMKFARGGLGFDCAWSEEEKSR